MTRTHRLWASRSAVLLTFWTGLLLTGSIPVSAATAEPPIDGNIGDDGVSAGGTWKLLPGNDLWTNAPIGLATDPRGYRFEIICLEGDDLSIACQRLNQQCTAADGGQLVRWFSGLKTADPSNWRDIGESCIYAEKPRDVLDEIAAVIAKEFQSRPVQAGSLSLQPSPHTLIRANTNFYIESQEQTFDFSLLDQDVRIVATPQEYTWHYGDGTSYGPISNSGAALHATHLGDETNTSHAYQKTGDYPVSVTVHFRGEYSVNGGQMIPIEGRGEFTTAEQTISVWKSESRNVADTCLENPASWGC